MFSCEFCEISQNTLFEEHRRMTASQYKNARHEYLLDSLTINFLLK